MSLLCVETERVIEYGDPLYAGTRNPEEMFTALSQPVIDRIPETCRSATPIAGGISIHHASAGRNFTGSYAWSSFKIREFLFCVSMADARQYLPRLLRELGC